MEAAVIAGHFGFAAAVKARAPSAPLWALMLGCVWLDVVFVPLFLMGIETLEPIAGTRGGYGQAVIHADYTHSLLGALALSALFGAAGAFRWGQRVGAVLAAVAFSHWLLDLPVHHHDMPLLPGRPGFLGFGLWSLPALAATIELALVLGGALAYWKAAKRIAGARANVPAAALLASGVVTLALNVLGL
jgi:hypothetical protein